MMTPEEIKVLADKVVSGEATQDEKVAFLKELNDMVEGMRADLKESIERKANI